jgi:GT2 family glycosyltransferase
MNSASSGSQPAVAIILVNWKSPGDTVECLDSLAKLLYPDFRVYVVDNGSSDASPEMIRSHLQGHPLESKSVVVDSIVNLGFAGGNNLGIRRATMDGFNLFWLLNNDTTVEPSTLLSLVEASRSDPRVGMVGSKIYYAGGSRLWYAGGYVNRWTGRGGARGKGELDVGQYNQPGETGYVTGCSLLVSGDLIRRVGKMRADYFLYYEETDWNLRAKRNGWRLLYEPRSVVHHKVGGATRIGTRNAPVLIYYNIRNRFTMTQRVFTPVERVSAVMYLHYQLISQFFMILRRDYRRGEAFAYLFLGYLHALVRRMGPAPKL